MSGRDSNIQSRVHRSTNQRVRLLENQFYSGGSSLKDIVRATVVNAQMIDQLRNNRQAAYTTEINLSRIPEDQEQTGNIALTMDSQASIEYQDGLGTGNDGIMVVNRIVSDSNVEGQFFLITNNGRIIVFHGPSQKALEIDSDPSAGTIQMYNSSGINTITMNRQSGGIIANSVNTDSLDVQTYNVANGGSLYFKDGNSANAYRLYRDTATNYFNLENNVYGDLITVKPGGNVGLQVANPEYRLDVDDDIRVGLSGHQLRAGSIGPSGSSDGAGIVNAALSNTASNYMIKQSNAGETKLNASSGQVMIFNIADSEAMRLDTNGNLGIGTDNPEYILDVSGEMRIQNSGLGSYVRMKNSLKESRVLSLNDGNVYMGGLQSGADGNAFVWSQNDIQFQSGISSSTQNMILTSGGSLGIGTTTPSYKLDVNGSTIVRGECIIENSSGDSVLKMNANTVEERPILLTDEGSMIMGATLGNVSDLQIRSSDVIRFMSDDGGWTEEMMTIKNSVDGRVGIRQSDPQEALDVNGNIYSSGYIATDKLSIGLSNNSPSSNYKLEVNGPSKFNSTLFTESSMQFDDSLRMKISLYDSNDDFGIGLQTNTTYFRSGGNFAFYKDGTHNDTALNPGTGGSSQMVILDNGNVGIGTTSPGYNLDVVGNARFNNGSTSQINIGTTNREERFVYFEEANGDMLIGTTLGGSNGNANRGNNLKLRASNDLYIETDGPNFSATRLTVLRNGNVGIGTMSPTQKLDVNGNIQLGEDLYFKTGSKSSRLMRYYNDTANKLDIGGVNTDVNNVKLISQESISLSTGLNASPRLTITESSGGFVGIGTTSPQYPLHITGNGSSLSTTPPTALIEQFNTNSLQFTTGGFGSDIELYVSANMRVGGSNIWMDSDKRIKTNISEIDDSIALEQLRKLKPCTYKYKDPVGRSSDTVIGYIAQEVGEVIPSAVTSNTKQFIPNLYQKTTCQVLSLTKVRCQHNDLDQIELEDKIKFYLPNVADYLIGTVKDKKNGSFEMELESEIQLIENIPITKIRQAFLYGKEVDDFHTLNKQYIYTVTTAALQELDREHENTKTKLANTKQELANANAKITSLEERLAQLEAVVARITANDA